MECTGGFVNHGATVQASRTVHCEQVNAVATMPHSFRVFSDRSASDLGAFEWNASMDLLACLTAPPDSTMSIYRLLSEDQSPKLLSEKITGVGTALTWSPCGRKVAVGDRLGGMAIYDGESGTVLHTRRLHTCSVTALSWFDAAAAGSLGGEPPWSRMLPPLLAVPSAPSNMYAEMPDADVEPNTGDDFSLLVSVDEAGLIVISAGGTFPLQVTQLFGEQPLAHPLSPCSADLPRHLSCSAAASLPEALREQQLALPARRPGAVRLSPDLRSLAVLLGPPGSAPSGGQHGPRSPKSPLMMTPSCGSSGPFHRQTSAGEASANGSSGPFQRQTSAGEACAKGSLGMCAGAISGAAAADSNDEVVLVLDVRKLAVRRRELAQCSSMTERLISVVSYTRQAVDLLAHVWRGAAEGFANKMRGLVEAMEAYGDQESVSIHDELLLTCCTGNPSDAVHAFLTRQTSPQQLTRLERTLMQAFEYVNLVACTRLQVAGNHILTILHELHTCASWAQKFKSIGLDVEPLQCLMSHTQEFIKLTELLLIECSQSRRFVRTLFQLLLRMAQSLAEQPAASEPGTAAPSKEELDDFVAGMRARRSLELTEIGGRIGVGRAAAAGAGPGAAGSSALGESPVTGATPGSVGSTASLASAVQRLAAETERVGERIATALSAHVALLACLPVHAPSPWASVSVPELRAVAVSDVASGVPQPRGLGRSTLSLTWETAEQPRLLLLWSGGGGPEAELHLCRVHLSPAPPGSPAPPRLERARLRVGGLLAAPGLAPAPAHFLLCQAYDQGRVAALVLQERPGAAGGAVVAVCLVDVSEHAFRSVRELGGAGVGVGEAALPPAASLADLPEGSVLRSVELPDSYIWASAMRVMAARGVCSVYACRARRLLTLDMQAEGDDDDDEDDAGD